MEKEEMLERFSEFLEEFYKKELASSALEKKKSIEIDFFLLDKFDIDLADILLERPEETLQIFEKAARQIESELDEEFRVRIFNLPESRQIRIRNLRAEHIGKLICVDGVVVRAAEVRPEVIEAVFQCLECGAEISIAQTLRVIKKPNKCENCNNQKSFSLVKQKLYDARWVVIEEPFEIVEAERPSSLMVYLKEDLTSPKVRNKTDPGNRIKIVGILKEIPRTLKGTRSRQMEIYIEANHIEALETEWEELEITEEDEKKIIELAKSADIYQKLVKSIAPGIYGLEHIKEAIALQLFSGTPKILPDKSRIRGDIHILLVGDPSTAKSQLMKVVSTLIPRSRYVSGKGVTGVGLTATVVRDEEFFGGWVLEAGALVLCNKSLLCVDEFEKIDKDDQITMHEAMEQQSYHKHTKILLANGKEIKINELVDKLILTNKEKVVKGKDCEILDTKQFAIHIFTTDFNKIYETKVTQVSRHKAPSRLTKITLENGRSIIVTPEHPFFISAGLDIITIPAQNLRVGQYIPTPTILPINGEKQTSKNNKFMLNKNFSKFIGYLLTDGGYEINRGKKNGINFTNANNQLVHDFCSLSRKIFGVNPYLYTRKNGVTMVRIVSKPLLNYLRSIEPTLIEKSEKKIIPEIITCGKNEIIAELLKAMFECDGYVSRNRIGFASLNRELCEQIQTLLLRFGISSRIFEEVLLSNQKFFRLSITGMKNLKKFSQFIGFLSQKKNRKLISQLKNSRSRSDIIPNVTNEVLQIAKKLKIKESKIFGYSITHFKKSGNILRSTLQRFVSEFEKKMHKIENLKKEVVKLKTIPELKKVRKILNISQEDIGKQIKVTHQTISNWERKSSNINLYKKGLLMFIDNMVAQMEKISKLKRLAFSEIGWTKIAKIEEIECRDEWVYDITVEPQKTFISECAVLHNSISIAKANIVATLPAQTSILAGGNPKLGRFDPYLPIKEQIEVPETLLARFDLKFALRDVPNKEIDSKIAEYILQTRHFKGETAKPEIEPELLRKYIAYARKNCFPMLCLEAGKKLKEFFVSLREKAASEEAAIPITLRQYEALIRLAEASAKIRLSEIVTEEDAIRAINLMKISLREFGFEPETGQFDIDRAEGLKTTAMQRSKIRTMLDIIDELIKAQGAEIEKSDVLKKAREAGIEDAEEILNKMLKEGIIFSPRVNKISKI